MAVVHHQPTCQLSQPIVGTGIGSSASSDQSASSAPGVRPDRPAQRRGLPEQIVWGQPLQVVLEQRPAHLELTEHELPDARQAFTSDRYRHRGIISGLLVHLAEGCVVVVGAAAAPPSCE